MNLDASLPLRGNVLVQEVNQYGRTVYQPANALARALADLVGTKTLTDGAIAGIKHMGLVVSTTGADPRIL